MNLTTHISAPWVILPDKLRNINDVLNAHIRGPKLNLKDMESRILVEDVTGDDDRGYYVENGIAIFAIDGPIVKNADIFDRVIFGMVSSSDILKDFNEAVNDAAIKGIILYIDSPGGTVDGTQELARAIFQARGNKPIIAYSDGYMTSGAYWIGAAADKMFISGDTITVGSIGVIRIHRESSMMDQAVGITITEFVSGKYKNANSPNSPLTDDAKTYNQEQVDYIFSIFINDVALFRGVTPERALEMSGEARVYIGQQAIEAGLVDGVSTFEGLFNIAGGIPAGNGKFMPSGAAAAIDNMNQINQKEAQMPITREQLAAESPELLEAIIGDGKALAIGENKANVEKAFQDGAAAELGRIKGIKEQMIPGHEALVEAMMFDGKSSASDAAMSIIQAEKKARENHLANMDADAPDGVKSDEPLAKASAKKAENDTRPLDVRAKEAWEKDSTLRAEFGENFNSYLAYENNADNIRIKGGDRK